jgi:hypothetical protein
VCGRRGKEGEKEKDSTFLASLFDLIRSVTVEINLLKGNEIFALNAQMLKPLW